MAKISSSIKKVNYKIEITSPTDNVVIADEPIDMGERIWDFRQKNYWHLPWLLAPVQQLKCMPTAKDGIYKK